MLPSGNDAATALAEHFGGDPRLAAAADIVFERWIEEQEKTVEGGQAKMEKVVEETKMIKMKMAKRKRRKKVPVALPSARGKAYVGGLPATHPVARFVHWMNCAADAACKEVGRRRGGRERFVNPHGLGHTRHLCSAGSMLALVCLAMRRFPRFRRIVKTRRAVGTFGPMERAGSAIRRFDWVNTNKLLRADGRFVARAGNVLSSPLRERGSVDGLLGSPLQRAATLAAHAAPTGCDDVVATSPCQVPATVLASVAAPSSSHFTTTTTTTQPNIHYTGVKTGWIPNAHGQRIHACLATSFCVLPDQKSSREADARDELLHGCVNLDIDDHNAPFGEEVEQEQEQEQDRESLRNTMVAVVLGSETKQQRFDDSERIARFIAHALAANRMGGDEKAHTSIT